MSTRLSCRGFGRRCLLTAALLAASATAGLASPPPESIAAWRESFARYLESPRAGLADLTSLIAPLQKSGARRPSFVEGFSGRLNLKIARLSAAASGSEPSRPASGNALPVGAAGGEGAGLAERREARAALGLLQEAFPELLDPGAAARIASARARAESRLSEEIATAVRKTEIALGAGPREGEGVLPAAPGEAVLRLSPSHGPGLLSPLRADFPPADGSPDIPHLRHRRQTEELYARVPSAEAYSSTPPVARMTRGKVVYDPQEGLLAKVLMIRRAEHTVDMTTFIFARDETGRIILDELRQALGRGVSVRLMVDSMGSLHPSHNELKALLNAPRGFLRDAQGNPTDLRATVEVKTINTIWSPRRVLKNLWLRLKNLFLPKHRRVAVGNRWRDRRSHDKLLLVDADYGEKAAAILGGRNISNAYYGVPKVNAKTYQDMEVLVRSVPDKAGAADIGNILGGYFDQLFYHRGNKTLGDGPLWRFHPAFHLNRQLKKSRKVAQAQLAPSTELAGKLARMEGADYLGKGFAESPAYFVNQIENLKRRNAWYNPEPENNPLNRPNGASITDNFKRLRQSAARSIDIVSPYLYLYPEEMETLKIWLAADPQRRLRIVTNSVYSADNVAAQALTDRELGPAFRKAFAEFGDRAQLLTYGRLDAQDLGGGKHYGKVHAKFVVFDGDKSLVTSSNGDPRSRYLNSELGYVFLGPEMGGKLEAVVEELAAGSTEWGSPEWKKLRRHRKLRLKMAYQKVGYPLIRLFKLRGLI